MPTRSNTWRQGLADVAGLIPACPDSLSAYFKYFLTPHTKFHRDILHSLEKLYLHEIIYCPLIQAVSELENNLVKK